MPDENKPPAEYRHPLSKGGCKHSNDAAQSEKDGSRPWRGVTDDMVADALVKSAGIIYRAAELVGLDRHAVARRISKSAKLKKIQQGIVEKVLDMAEAQVIKYISNGDKDMIRFYLNNKGRERGYGNRIDLGIARDAEPPRIIDDITDAEVVCEASDSEA